MKTGLGGMMKTGMDILKIKTDKDEDRIRY